MISKRATIFDGDQQYDISHLSGFCFSVVQPDWTKEIEVRFSWHCYTRTPDHSEKVYILRNGKERRCFCPERYELSFHLPKIISELQERYIVQTGRGNYMTVELLNEKGEKQRYGVFFSLRKGAPKQPLRLTVESAYALTSKQAQPRASRQKIRFRVVVFNTWRGKTIRYSK